METTTTPPEPQPAAQQHHEPPRPRVTNACEACRVAKVKCRASTQLGICRRCLESKRECIFKTGPRTRRPRLSKLNDSAPRLPPPPGRSKTFTIDIPMPPDDEVGDSFEALRGSHEGFIDGLVPGSDSDADDNSPSASHASSLPLGASALSTPPSSVASASAGRRAAAASAKRSVASFGLQPQFNLDSAAALLDTFRGRMLSHFPCVALRRPPGGQRHGVGGGGNDDSDEVSVPVLARTRPFVLLALLSAASGSRTLQGHSLYDEEFRKILGLKFVAGGERSLELLQGLVVYVAWYPFHLRPKNKQAIQYVRMAVDIIHDLELDQDPGPENENGIVSRRRLEEMRTYLATYYLVCNFATTWNKSPSLQYTEYNSRCCDVLESHSRSTGEPSDSVLAWLVRLQRIVEEVSDMRRVRGGQVQSEYQVGLMLKGMESQLNEWEGRMAPIMASTPSLRMSLLSTRTFLAGAPLLKFPSVKSSPALDATSPFRADPARLSLALPLLRAFYEYVLTLPGAEWSAFGGMGWSAFIQAVILGFRLSFPLPVCPAWDAAAARRELRFGEYLGRMCRVGGGASEGEDDDPTTATPRSKSMDVLRASKVVLAVVGRKFARRVAKLEPAVPAPAPAPPPPSTEQLPLPLDFFGLRSAIGAALGLGGGAGTGASSLPATTGDGLPAGGGLGAVDRTMAGCPMMDGSLESYYPYWDETYSKPHSSSFLAGMGALGAGSLGGGGGDGQPMQSGADLNDNLWTMMTMGWAQNDINFDHL